MGARALGGWCLSTARRAECTVGGTRGSLGPLWTGLQQAGISESLGELDEEGRAGECSHSARGSRGKEWGGALVFQLAAGAGARFGSAQARVGPPAAAGSLRGLARSAPPLQPLHALSLLSTDGTQVSPGAHCPSPPGTGKRPEEFRGGE